MYDVIVVGARCAGASTALLFARAGYRVLLVERSAFPTDTLSTLYIHQPGVAALQRWGVLADLVATGVPALDRVEYSIGDIRLTGCSWPADGQRSAYAPRRYLLDRILADAAVAAGAEFRDRCALRDLVFDGERVVGVRLESTRAGAAVERAALVVGADGMRSTVAARVDAGTELEDPTVTCAYYTYWSDLPTRFRLYEATGGWVGTIPTNDGLTLVAGYFPQRDFAAVRADARNALLGLIERIAPEVRAEMAAGRQAERLYGTGDQRNFFRQAAGPGWALVGDAGHHKDSITARGITDAFHQAQLLVDCVGPDLHDPVRLTAALQRFSARRTDDLLTGYRATLKTARLSAPPHYLDLLRAVATSPGHTDRYFSTMSGVCPVDELVDGDLLDILEGQQVSVGDR